MRLRISAIVIAVLVGLGLARPSSALFHMTVIDEMMTSYGGDPSVQFIEMRMLASVQNSVDHSVFAAFDGTGTYISDILVVPANLSNSGTGTRWLVGTAAFQTQTGLAPDFIMPAGILPTGGGMVCFGGGGGLLPQNPPSWDRKNFATYVDCVAYGTFTGSSNVEIGTPTSLNGDGHSLQRTTSTHNNSADFTCANPAIPQNNTGATMSMPATDPCAAAAATATATPTSPTPTATVLSIHPCTGDCSGDGHVNVNELIVAVNIALGYAQLSTCPAFGNADTVSITELIAAVNNALNGCPATPTTS